MKKTILSATLASIMFTGAAFASSDIVLNDEIKAQITEVLTEQGYEVAKIKTEDGLYEAYAKKDGQKFEVFLNAEMEIVRTKED